MVAEVYDALFENFMLPVPCGYDELLHKTYGDYEVIRKKREHMSIPIMPDS